MEDDTSENQADRWQRRQHALAAPRVAIPVYTPDDYPLIRQLPGTDDMPPTWEEWRKLLEVAQKQRARAGDYRVRPVLFQAWLDANSQVPSDRSRQRYAQELLDTRAARRVAYDKEHRQEIEATGERPAAPVYTPHDYPLILELSVAGDLPATWEEWWENFKASEAERRRQGLFATQSPGSCRKIQSLVADQLALIIRTDAAAVCSAAAGHEARQEGSASRRGTIAVGDALAVVGRSMAGALPFAPQGARSVGLWPIGGGDCRFAALR